VSEWSSDPDEPFSNSSLTTFFCQKYPFSLFEFDSAWVPHLNWASARIAGSGRFCQPAGLEPCWQGTRYEIVSYLREARLEGVELHIEFILGYFWHLVAPAPPCKSFPHEPNIVWILIGLCCQSSFDIKLIPDYIL
jgi:hypothetical protein